MYETNKKDVEVVDYRDLLTKATSTWKADMEKKSGKKTVNLKSEG